MKCKFYRVDRYYEDDFMNHIEEIDQDKFFFYMHAYSYCFYSFKKENFIVLIRCHHNFSIPYFCLIEVLDNAKESK